MNRTFKPAGPLRGSVTPPATLCGVAALVLTHGAAMDHQMFDAQLPAFADHRLLVWDVPGHGES